MTGGRHYYYLAGLIAWILLSNKLCAEPLIDTHLHYNADHAAQLSPDEVIGRLDRNHINMAVVTGTPPQHTAALYRYAPKRIIPFLSVYQTPADKARWFRDKNLLSRIQLALKQGIWRGIGEIHLFAADRHRPVFRQLIHLAETNDLPLLIHGDPAVIDTIYENVPGITVIWAHGGTYPYPELLADYLERYPSLYVDVSMRDARISPDGKLSDAWYELFVSMPERFLVGVDTYSLSRWRDQDDAVAAIRHWLRQLPPDIASRLARHNAIKLFKIKHN